MSDSKREFNSIQPNKQFSQVIFAYSVNDKMAIC